jgi:hypothetical protein
MGVMPEDSPHRPILIVGANGTGTTLLRLMLDSHEHIAIPHETGFLRLAAVHRWVPYWELGDQWAKSLDLTDDALMQRLAAFYGGLFSSYAEGRGKQRWGDKTPFHVWHLELATRMFPEVQVVGIVRHPGAVVTSLRRRFRRPLGRSVRHWKRSTRLLLQQAAQLGDRCVVLRYEDLVLAPEPTMRSLLEWLDEPWSDAVLAHHEVQQSAGGAAEVEGFTRTDTPIDAAHVTEWEKHLRGDALAKVVARTGELATFLGYDPSRALPVEALREGGPAYLTGSEVLARQRERGGAINWERRAKPPVADRPLRPPAPRRRNRRGTAIEDVSVGDVLKNRAMSAAKRRLPEDARKRANEIRRTKPAIDKIIGPR